MRGSHHLKGSFFGFIILFRIDEYPFLPIYIYVLGLYILVIFVRLISYYLFCPLDTLATLWCLSHPHFWDAYLTAFPCILVCILLYLYFCSYRVYWFLHYYGILRWPFHGYINNFIYILSLLHSILLIWWTSWKQLNINIFVLFT